MPNKIPQIYEAQIEAQASAAITVDTDSTGALITIDNSISGDGKGCQKYKCFANVSSAPTGDAVARVKYAGAITGTPDNFDEGTIGAKIPSGQTGVFEIGDIRDPAPVSRCKLAAEAYGFTASLIVIPILPEVQ